jgi:hypothetical protein
MKMQTYVVKVSTELVGDDSADVRQNLGLVLHKEIVTNNQYLLRKKASIPDEGDHARFGIVKQIDLQRPCIQGAGHGRHGEPEPEQKEIGRIVSKVDATTTHASLEISECRIIAIPARVVIHSMSIMAFKNGQCTFISGRFPSITKINQPYLSADSNATAGGNGGGERSLHFDY